MATRKGCLGSNLKAMTQHISSEDVDASVSTKTVSRQLIFFSRENHFWREKYYSPLKNGSPGKDVEWLALAGFCLIRRLLNFCHRWHFPLFNHKLSSRLLWPLHYETIQPPLSFNLMRRYFRNAAFAGDTVGGTD